MEKMIFLPIGYPLNFRQNENTFEYVIENAQGIHSLGEQEFMLWTDLLRKNSEYDLNPGALNALKEKKAVVYADSGSNLFSLLFSYVPVRQGFGGISDSKYCVVLGEKIFFPSKLQLDFWEKADGKATVLDIMRSLAQTHKMVSAAEKEDFVNQLKGLMTCSLLFLR